MKETIIAVYGRAGEGKSTTIKNVVQIFERLYPSAVIIYLEKGADILVTIQLGNVKIGIESQGDPGSRMLWSRTVERLATVEQCQIIVCATRTEGNTVREVDRVAEEHGYYTIWKSSYYTWGLNTDTLNQMAAEEVVKLIEAIIVERI